MARLDTTELSPDPLLRRAWQAMGCPAGSRVVGGYVRDRLLGRPSSDLDLTLDGEADDAAGPARRLAEAHEVHAHLLGTAPHRIWRIETPSLEIEIWPLGGLTPEADIRRRDFSCNALSWELPDGPLVDLVGGLADIRDGRLRAVSRENLASDPVRLLRGPRFLAELADFDLDDRTRGWIRELAPALASAPRERVGQELLKLLRGPAASRGLRACLELGLFASAAPESCEVDATWLNAHLEAADALNERGIAGFPPAGGRSGNGGDAARLALLFRAWGFPADRAVAPYAWPKPVRESGLRASRLLDDALTKVGAPAADRRELAWRAGTAFPALVALASACEPDVQGWSRWRRQRRRDPEALLDPKPLLSGDEIAELTGIEPGPELGKRVDALLRAQVRGEIRSRGGAVRWLRHRHGR